MQLVSGTPGEPLLLTTVKTLSSRHIWDLPGWFTPVIYLKNPPWAGLPLSQDKWILPGFLSWSRVVFPNPFGIMKNALIIIIMPSQPGSVTTIDILYICLYVICISLLYAWKEDILATKNLFSSLFGGDVLYTPMIIHGWVFLGSHFKLFVRSFWKAKNSKILIKLRAHCVGCYP